MLTCMAEGSWPLEFKWLHNNREADQVLPGVQAKARRPVPPGCQGSARVLQWYLKGAGWDSSSGAALGRATGGLGWRESCRKLGGEVRGGLAPGGEEESAG